MTGLLYLLLGSASSLAACALVVAVWQVTR
jgi:hypothetical protein